jgi:YD repeat-containing protein
MKQGILTVAALLALAAATDGHAQSFSRTDATTYDDNLHLWVIGQPRKSTNLDTGLVESESVYDPITGLTSETHAFGTLQAKYTYNADGTMATASDANDAPTFDTTVTFGNWKRGTPQTITFPDGHRKSALVDDDGLIREVTDEAGNKTCYDFDAMGRLSKITYPSDTQPGVCDTSKWEPTTITFDDGYAAAYGMPAGHWRQTTLTWHRPQGARVRCAVAPRGRTAPRYGEGQQHPQRSDSPLRPQRPGGVCLVSDELQRAAHPFRHHVGGHGHDVRRTRAGRRASNSTPNSASSPPRRPTRPAS